MIRLLELPTVSLANAEVIQKETDTLTNRYKHAKKPIKSEMAVRKGNE